MSQAQSTLVVQRPNRHRGERRLVGTKTSGATVRRVDDLCTRHKTTRNDWLVATIEVVLRHPDEVAAELRTLGACTDPVPVGARVHPDVVAAVDDEWKGLAASRSEWLVAAIEVGLRRSREVATALRRPKRRPGSRRPHAQLSFDMQEVPQSA